MEKNFSLTPTVSISRSKFLRRSQHKTSINLGDIVPTMLELLEIEKPVEMSGKSMIKSKK